MDINNMNIDKKKIYALIVAFFSIATALVFQKESFADANYGTLTGAALSLESAKMINSALFVLLPLAVYLIATYLLKADKFHSFAAALLFAASGANYEALFSLHPAISVLFGKQYGIFDALKAVGAVAPLGAVALLEYRKDIVTAALAGIGLAAIPFAPGVSAFFLALAAGRGIGILEGAHAEKVIVFAVALFAFQTAYSGDAAYAAAAAALIGILAYIVLSLHRPEKEEVYSLLLLFLAAGVLAMLYSLNAADARIVPASEIQAFAAAKEISGTIGVFANPGAVAYYSGKNAVLLNASALLKKDVELPESVLFSSGSLDSAYGGKPLFFSYRTTLKYREGDVAVFTNSRYALYMGIGADGELVVDDALLEDMQTSERSEIAFTKIKRLFSGSFLESTNRMVNMQELGESGLYSILFGSETVFEGNGTKIVKVG